MTAEELKDIALCGETTTIQYKQEFTGQKEIAKSMQDAYMVVWK